MTALNRTRDRVNAIIDAEIGDQECAVELLHDLVMLLNEQAATGGGPNYYARWRAAFQRAESFLGLDDTND